MGVSDNRLNFILHRTSEVMKRFLVNLVVGIAIFLKFSDCIHKEQAVHVRILGKIEGYGDNLTLICTLDKNETSPKDNKRWYIDDGVCSSNNRTNDPKKFKAQLIPDGVQLTILNFLTQDINKTYHCTIGFYQSEKLFLSESDVFRENSLRQGVQPNKGGKKDEVKQEDISPADEESDDEMINSKDDKNSDYIDTLVYVVIAVLIVFGLISISAHQKKNFCFKGNKESSLHLEGKHLMNGKQDALCQNRIPDNEERNASSSDLEKTSLMINKKNAEKNQDIYVADDQSSGFDKNMRFSCEKREKIV